MTSELKKLEALFLEGLVNIDKSVNFLTEKSVQSFEKLKSENTNFIRAHKSSFNDVTSFIKNDYRSLTQSLEQNNDLLGALLQKTEENIIKNRELKPLLINSNDELEKVYGKIKMLITNYEKSINDIQDEMESSLHNIESILESKIKQLATSGEKTIQDSIENSKVTIAKVTEETNNGLKKVLKENQIKRLVEKVEIIDSEFKMGLEEVQESISKLDEVFIKKFKEFLESNKNSKSKSPFNDLKKWWDS
ncbi:hypothetical protein [Psychroserpens algicola]|uniref:Uncharacterized protein n=1 Tax=Psychroserpens algicola TaxID=1719034 RepID=A0ABT0H968_9FLAO|nr:hypothetical protein [Psychroserpens algicola]MCK8480913.1 hypothetical protein [Psychroserpens algicola]